MSIRPVTEADLPEMLAIYAPYVENTTISFEYSAPSLEEFSGRYHRFSTQFPWLVYEENNTVLGYAYAAPAWERTGYAWCAESSIYLAPSAQRRGIGRALYQALEKILTCQGYRILYAVITQENAPSVAFHSSLGFQICARFPSCGYKMDKWLDVVWMEKELNLRQGKAEFPKKWLDCAEYLL